MQAPGGCGPVYYPKATVRNKRTVLRRPREDVDSEVKVTGELDKRSLLVPNRGVNWSRGAG